MPWTTPSLADTRKLVRDSVAAKTGAPVLPNSRGRVLADVMAGVAHPSYLYLDWLADQLLPDTAGAEWLDRHAQVSLGGRLPATFASGTVSATGTEGAVLPINTQMTGQTADRTIRFKVTASTTIGPAETNVPVVALDAGADANFEADTILSLSSAVSGVDGNVTVVDLAGGADIETDDALRARLLAHLRRPPMGGSADDYVRWTKEVADVTRAWVYPGEMGVGTVTVRFMCDVTRAPTGIPNGNDVARVRVHLDEVRPVAVADLFVQAPVAYLITFTITGLVNDTTETRAAIDASVRAMLQDRAAPGQTIYRSWIDEAISEAIGEDYHELVYTSTSMPSPGHIGRLGSIVYA